MEQKDINETDNQSVEEMDINSDDSIPGTSHINDMMEEESATQKLQDNLDEQKDKYLRLVAEFDNYKRRNAKERIELIQTAGKEVIIDLLDVLDDTDRAEKQFKNIHDIEEVKNGVQLIFNKMRHILQNKGLKAMSCLHAEFDTELHEAITEIPAPTPELKGKVVDELTKGYFLNDKIIRYAKVVIGK